MQNAKCKVQSEGVAFGDYLNKFAKQIHSFCILHFARQCDKLEAERSYIWN